jgi:hypothetical protein
VFDKKSLAIAVGVFGFLGYYTFQIKQAIDRPVLVVSSEQPVTIGGNTVGFKLALDKKWHTPSETGKAWLADVWAVGRNEGGSTTEQFICPRPECEQPAVLSITHGRGAVNAAPELKELDPVVLTKLFDFLGCGKRAKRDAVNLALRNGVAYRFTCGFADASGAANPFSANFVAWKDHHFVIKAMTFPAATQDYDIRLADEVTRTFAALE